MTEPTVIRTLRKRNIYDQSVLFGTIRPFPKKQQSHVNNEKKVPLKLVSFLLCGKTSTREIFSEEPIRKDGTIKELPVSASQSEEVTKIPKILVDSKILKVDETNPVSIIKKRRATSQDNPIHRLTKRRSTHIF